ncbi:hypothetical protein RHMOL_Rhmol08G0187500 [Rhododendron molle]|uniref:Uncharacterized protein n=1 Tax=Rhododendron molle TaxID=49168 RepID=A0ACC0MQJ1_RHOML|nr:hypothetical protein RHMOL_Rhmol08G0187500 [Rhododendron molle]
MAPPKKKTKRNVVAVDCRNEELKEMDEECRNEVPKHPRNAWIFFYQEQCKLKDDDSLKPMSMEEISKKTQLKAAYDTMQELDPLQVKSVKAIGLEEHCTPAEYFTSRCGMRPSPHLSAWGDKDIRERACWFNKTRKRKGEKKPTMEAEPKRADVMATLSNEKQLMLRYGFDHTQSER